MFETRAAIAGAERGSDMRRFGTNTVFRLMVAGVALGGMLITPRAEAQTLPEIRTNAKNKVPACVTPQRLMRYLRTGNSNLPMQFSDIATHYKEHGERLGVRWDYAFFQMILETNYLKFKNAAGQGDVNPRQNNFAGIGTTGGGVPGDSFPNVSTGVLGQMQHLIAYSGERVANPVARRTREKQDEIIQRSRALGRPVTFKDLTRRWAADSRYGSSIEFVASRFRAAHCNGSQPDDEVAPTKTDQVAAAEPADVRGRDKGNKRKRRGGNRDEREVVAAPAPEEPTPRTAATRATAEDGDVPAQRSGLGVPPAAGTPQFGARAAGCKVFTASYGGRKNLLIRAVVGSETHYTALQVLDGMEKSLGESFVVNHTKGGEVLSEHPSRDEALTKAFNLCQSAQRPQ